MRGLPAIALLLLGLPVIAATPPAPLEMDSILAMIEARVGDAIILRQARAAGISFTLGVEEVLSLKRAGASDELIAGLMDLQPAAPGGASAPDLRGSTPAPGNAGDAEAPSFRIYSDVDDDGRKVVHITNLDEAGRRMGKPAPVTEPVPSNAYQSRSGTRETEEWEDWESGEEMYPEPARAGAGQPPVIVNVFNPVAEAAALAESAPDYYDRRFVRGYLPYVPCTHRGHGGRHWVGLPSPPGSWSHYKLYHSGGNFGHDGLYDGGLWWRSHRGGFTHDPRGRALPVPFITAGAEQLNRMRANVRLGH